MAALALFRSEPATLPGVDAEATGVRPGPSSADARRGAADPASGSPTPASAASTTERRPARGEGLELVVEEPEGAKLADALVVVYRERQVLSQVRSDVAGVARVAALDQGASYAIAAPGWAIALGELERGEGRRTLRLAEGAVLGGTVLVDGAPPSAPIDLDWFEDSWPGTRNSLPGSVTRILRAERGLRFPVPTRTGVDGAFRFRGLDLSLHGSIQWCGPYFLARDAKSARGAPQQRVDVAGSQSELELRFESGIELRLRVVDPHGTPVPDAVVAWRRDSKETARRREREDRTDENGRFAFAFPREPRETFLITVAQDGWAPPSVREFMPPEGGRGIWDVGDIATGGARSIRMRVQDALGLPIARAEIGFWPELRKANASATGADGLADVQVGVEKTRVAVSALGYEPAVVDVPPEASESVVTLANACVLEFEAPGLPANEETLQLELLAPTPLFVEGAKTDPPTPRCEGRIVDARSLGELTLGSTWLQGAESAVIAGFRPGVSIRAQLRSGPSVVSRAEIGPLEPGERRAVVMRLVAPPSLLRLRVLTPEDRPLESAIGILATEGGTAFFGRDEVANASGIIEYAGVYGDSCTVRVHAPGFAPSVIALRPIPTGVLDVRLEPARTVEVELVGPDGAPFVEPARLYSYASAVPVEVRETVARGRYRLEGLPPAEVGLWIQGDFAPVQCLIDGRRSTARVAIGGKARVVVRASGAFGHDEDAWNCAIAEAGSPTDLARGERGSPDGDVLTIDFQGLFPGRYDVWLERRTPNVPDAWERVGAPTPVVIGGEETRSELVLRGGQALERDVVFVDVRIPR